MVLPAWNMLVVDDDELLCETAIDALKSIGIRAEWTLSGEKAIELVNQHHKKREDYQIILLDWKLPGMNGIQVAKEIRRNLGDEVPILLISHMTGVNLKQRPVKQVSVVLFPSRFLNLRCIMLCVSIWTLEQSMSRH